MIRVAIANVLAGTVVLLHSGAAAAVTVAAPAEVMPVLVVSVLTGWLDRVMGISFSSSRKSRSGHEEDLQLQ